ncbi:MAG: two-component regulator propeller domain-containing protein [Bacteroidota bacterium]|nr:two-component regulator propeller domain-containing protein [Bacteroidota bacterium]
MKNIYSILLFAIFIFLPFGVHANGYKFGHIELRDGLSDNQVNCIMKDRKGFIWIGTQTGLNRYDGYRFKWYQHDFKDKNSLTDNYVSSIQEALDGKLWITTRLGLVVFDPVTETFERDMTKILKPMGINKPVTQVYIDQKKNYWLFTANEILCYDIKLRKLLYFQQNAPGDLSRGVIRSMYHQGNRYWFVFDNGLVEVMDANTKLVVKRDNFITTDLHGRKNMLFFIFVDSDQDVWVYSDETAVYMYKKNESKWHYLSTISPDLRLNNNVIKQITEERNGIIWIGTDHGGINIVDKKANTIQYLTNIPDDPQSISQNSIQYIFRDDLGIMWVGTYKKGLNYYHSNIFKFHLEEVESSNPFSIPYNDVNCFYEDKAGNIWMGSNGGGLLVKEALSGKYRQYKASPNGLGSNIIVSVRGDAKGQIWVGTFRGGLNCLQGNQFRQYRHNLNDPNSISSNNVWDIAFDPAGNIWVGTIGGGLDIFDPAMKKIAHLDANNIHINGWNYVSTLTPDYPYMIVGTSEGVYAVDMRTRKPVNLFQFEGSQKSLSNTNVNFVFKDSRGLYWVGTREGLNLYNIRNKRLRVFTIADGLPDNVIQAMVEDQEQNLWVSTVRGLSHMIIPREGLSDSNLPKFVNYDVNDGLQNGPFNYKGAFRTSHDVIYFSGVNGINHFRLEDIKVKEYDVPIVFTDLQIYNTSIKAGIPYKGKVILDKSITETDKLVLDYNDNFFSIEFASLNYRMQEVKHYDYKLEGFNSQWLMTDEDVRKVTYTNLSPGTYTLLIKANLKRGGWGQSAARLTIVILPPWWLSTWAYIAYILMIIASVWLIRRSIIRKHEKKLAYEQMKMEAEHQHNLDEMKLRFFTNISHEFRTPLTLILTPIEKMVKTARDLKEKEQLEMIMRNARQLLTLVNQVLDFRKLDMNGQHLNLSQGDVIVFAKEIFNSFTDGFSKKNIRAMFDSSIDALWVNFDQDKLQKVLMNLLSNALKFTPEKGEILVKISANEAKNEVAMLKISVSDTGKGIPTEYLDKIFDRFFQVPQSNLSQQGSGIGLHLVKEFVKLMEGEISVESTEGKGTTFTLELPLNLIPQEVRHRIEPEESPEAEFVTEPQAKAAKEAPLLLLVEDNDDFRRFMRDNLRESYRVIEASNGKKGLELTISEIPDMIVSDVMMPEMDGIEMSRLVKNDIRTSHIPIILLTAKSSEEAKLESLEIGVDDYITKPFNLDALLLKIRNLTERREAKRQIFQKQVEIEPSQITINSLDEKLIEKAIKIVEENISNSEFSVEELSRSLGMSRVYLYKKLVSITGKTPIEFIRIIRLKRAAQLLEKSQLSISEIAYEVGFNSPKYFSKYFKDEFGVLPSAYVEKK